MCRVFDARSIALNAQRERVAAEIEMGAAERCLYEARRTGGDGAIAVAQQRVCAARRELHRAIDADEAAYLAGLAIEEELERKAEQRRAAKARREAAVLEQVAA